MKHWHSKYWDAIDQLYWTPSHLGLRSINKAHWGRDPDMITIPRSMVTSGTIYTRTGNSRDNAARLHRLEEPLNHIFDITFAITPDPVLVELFLAPFGIRDSAPIDRIGREAQVRYGWGGNNVTQQDLFLVSPSSAVGVEIKLRSKTWREQVLKYLTLMVCEQRRSGPRESLGLLYITPQKETAAVWKECGATPEGRLPPGWLDDCKLARMNPTLIRLLSEARDEFENSAARLVLKHTTWDQFVEDCGSVVDRHKPCGGGDDTLVRLLSGFQDAVRNQVGAIATK